MENLKTLNKHVTKRIKDYQTLKIAGLTVPTPYYINNIGNYMKRLLEEAKVPEEKVEQIRQAYKNKQVPFGWYRGKGTPEQIADAAVRISKEVSLPLKGATKNGVLEFMKLYGLGIDCSGFVYNVLSYAFEKVGELGSFNESLGWASEKQEKHNVYYAGTFAFAGKASRKIPLKNIQPPDLLLIRNEEGYSHIGIVIRKGLKLKLAQSSISTIPAGVTATNFSIKDGKPVFGFKSSMGSDWVKLYKNKKLEFRRLACLDR